MSAFMPCPRGGCGVRLPRWDLRGWWEHYDSAHPAELPADEGMDVVMRLSRDLLAAPADSRTPDFLAALEASSARIERSCVERSYLARVAAWRENRRHKSGDSLARTEDSQ